MRARHYSNPLPLDTGDAGEVYRYGRPVEWGWTCFTCETTGTGMIDQQAALRRLSQHRATEHALSSAPARPAALVPVVIDQTEATAS